MLPAPEAGDLWNYSCYNCSIEKRFSLAGCYKPDRLERNITAGRKRNASNTVNSTTFSLLSVTLVANGSSGRMNFSFLKHGLHILLACNFLLPLRYVCLA